MFRGEGLGIRDKGINLSDKFLNTLAVFKFLDCSFNYFFQKISATAF